MTIKPPCLKKGDLISIVSPASTPTDASRVHSSVKYFESKGYRVTISKNVFNINGYLAGTDEERAEDLNQAFADKNVRAIVCSRGGYGTPRILDRLDYGLIRRNPKLLIGYSDITALQLAIFKKTGLVTFSGPMAAVEFGKDIDPYTEEMFFQMVTQPGKIGPLKNHKSFRLSFKGKKRVLGRLLGGNLSLITSLFGTQYAPDFSRSLLLIEEVSEEPYSIDRMLTQLRLSGVLKKVSAFVLGQFTECNPEEPNRPHRTLEEIISNDLLSYRKASVSNIPYGHVPVKMTLPIGVLASVDPVKRRFSIDEAAVS
ncbi:MAG: LD-carboxypeptidase [Bacteroidetes bacterium]|nr:LD-carboxypeptidase [Bacteroidota bacterium]